VLACVVQIDVHLARVGGRELSNLEVDHHEAVQPAMEEQEIDPVLRVPDSQATLSADEGEPCADRMQALRSSRRTR